MSRFHNLDASIAQALEQTAPTSEATTAADSTTTDKPTGEPEAPATVKDEATMADTETPLVEREDYKAGHAAGAAAANDRMKAVFESEHFAGREAHAARLLGNAKLDAADIIAELPNFAKAEAAVLTTEQQAEAAEAGGRAEMRDAMATAGNANLGADDTKNEAKTGRAKADSVWDKANAAVGRVKKEG